MNPSEHEALRESLGAFALGQLGAEERLEIQSHLDGCADCRAELAAIAALAEPLRRVDPSRLGLPESAPAGLESSIVASVRSQRRARRRPAVRIVLAAAAFVAIGAVGAVGVGVGYGLAPKPPKIPLEPVAVAEVAGIQSTVGVVPHTWGMEIKLTATGFDDGQRYRAIVVTATGQQAEAGEFIGTGPNEMRCNLNSSVLSTNAMAVHILDDSNRIVLASNL